ncbi:AHH domain-containing protein [Winogradskyella sp.]|uniref:AHH domain-containing protein n=1 Tax=Winogradskyella sp. TaxID=1883156 RepID=UPI0025D313BE|nr:AHH domain-containing protein [Winogradskyella sp.]
MKKKQLKNYLKIVILFFGISLLLYGCQKDVVETIDQELPSQKGLFSTIDFNDFKNRAENKDLGETDISSLISNEQFTLVQSLYTTESEKYVISIDSTEVLVAEKEGTITYTFKTETQDISKNTNYILALKGQDIEEFYLTYDYDGKSKIIDPDTGLEVTTNGDSVFCHFSEEVWVCECEPQHRLGNNCSCTGGFELITVVTYELCSTDSSGGGTSDPIDDNPDESSGGTSGNNGDSSNDLPLDGIVTKDFGSLDINTMLNDCLGYNNSPYYDVLLLNTTLAMPDDIKTSIANFISTNGCNEETTSLITEIIDLAINNENQNDTSDLINLTLLLENSDNQLFTDEFASSLFQYIDLDLSTLPPDFPPNLLTIKVYINYKKLRQLNPEWSRVKCLWEATKDIIHISLDVFGLIPIVGEAADLVNGVLYTIEGDSLNATLSFAATIPFVGIGSTATKYGLKVINVANDINTKVKLAWKVTANGIEFGSRGQLRKILGLAVGNALQAHHIIPWAKRSSEIIQQAAKSGNAFHMNEALNGIAVAAWRNQPNHNFYNDRVQALFDALPSNLTPNEAYDAVTNIIDTIRNAIVNNPNTHLNDLVF